MKFFLVIFVSVVAVSCKKDWSYEGSSAPQYWGELDEKFKFCKIGYNQSPIDIKEKFTDGDLKFSYRLSDIEKQRENYAMNINFDGNSEGQNFLLRGKKKYLLRKMLFRHPSEHLLDGAQHSLELQIYHKSDDEQWLVLGIFLEVGKENSEFKKLVNFLTTSGVEGKIDLSKIVKSDDKSFFYDGSFTTPPCKEGVKWYVMQTPIEISKSQMNQIIKSAIFSK